MLAPAYDAPEGAIDQDGFYTYGRFPSTAARIQRYEQAAPKLAAAAVEKLELGADAARITHLIVASCTGVSAPGLDFDLVTRFGLTTSVERTVLAFMGCYAAINGLKLARHIVRSEPDAKVLLVCVELCTLHLKETDDLEQILTFSVFGDGCAAALVTSEPTGLRLESFHAALAPGAADQITWTIRDLGFDMVLSGSVPGEIGQALRRGLDDILVGRPIGEIDLWAVHPGGRSVLDAVENGLALPAGALAASREVLRANGNMSSATVLFVLKAIMRDASPGRTGRPRPPGRQNDLIGLKRHLRLAPPAAARLAGAVTLGLFPGGYAGIEPVEGGLANLCLLVRESAFAAHGRNWAQLIDAIAASVPRLGGLLSQSDALDGRPLAIARMPYGLVRASVRDGLWRLGDQAAVIPSFAGEGMSIALHSAALAADAMLSGGAADSFQRQLAMDVGRQVGLATALSRALVRPAAQAAMVAAARLAPAALSILATRTRIKRLVRDRPAMRPPRRSLDARPHRAA